MSELVKNMKQTRTLGFKPYGHDFKPIANNISHKTLFSYRRSALNGRLSHGAPGATFMKKASISLLDNEIEIYLSTHGGIRGPLSPRDIEHIMKRIKTLREDYGIEHPDEQALITIQRIARERRHSPRTEILNRWTLKYWAAACGININLDPNKGSVAVPAPKQRKRNPTGKAVSDKVVRLLLDDPEMPLRDKALIAVLAYGGERVTETCMLQISDVNLERRALFYRAEATKDNEDRWAFIKGIEPWSLLTRWIDARAKWLTAKGKSTDLLFITDDGKPMNEDNVRKMCYRCEKRHPEIKTMLPPGEKHLHPHLFRHAAAMKWVRAGDVKQAQHQLGHRNISTTVLYLADDEQAREKTSAGLTY